VTTVTVIMAVVIAVLILFVVWLLVLLGKESRAKKDALKELDEARKAREKAIRIAEETIGNHAKIDTGRPSADARAGLDMLHKLSEQSKS